MSKDVLVKNIGVQLTPGQGAQLVTTLGGNRPPSSSGALPHKKTIRERFGGALGGAAGAGLALTGKHRDFGGFLNALLTGYSTMKPLGEAAGRKLVTPQQQINANQRLANRIAARKFKAGEKIGIVNPKTGKIPEKEPYTSPILDQVQELKRRKNQPAEEVAVTPENMRLPAEAGVVPVTHQLAGKPPLLLGPGDWTEETLPESDQGVIEDNPFYVDGGVKVVGPPPLNFRTARGGPSKEVKVQPQRAVDPWAGTGISSEWGQGDVPVYPPSASSELFSNQQASDAALQANAAAARQKIMVTPPPLPLQTTGGANKELNDGENEETFMGTSVTDSKAGVSPPAPPAGPPASKDPKIAVQEAFKQGLEGSPATTGTPGNMGTVGISPTLRNALAGAAEGFDEVGTSIDRLPVIGIRKAQTRRVLIV